MNELAFYAALFASFVAVRVVYVKTGVFIGYYVMAALMLACAGIVRLRGQKLSSIGFTRKNMVRSALVGLALGIVVTLIVIVPQTRAGAKLIGRKDVLFNFFRYFFIIGLGEEILFRGYIQTRIYGIIKSDTLAVLLVGAMFAADHFPFQTYALGMSAGQYFREAAFHLVFWHVVHNALYRKYRTLSGPVMLHGLIDFAQALFR